MLLSKTVLGYGRKCFNNSAIAGFENFNSRTHCSELSNLNHYQTSDNTNVETTMKMNDEHGSAKSYSKKMHTDSEIYPDINENLIRKSHDDWINYTKNEKHINDMSMFDEETEDGVNVTWNNSDKQREIQDYKLTWRAQSMHNHLESNKTIRKLDYNIKNKPIARLIPQEISNNPDQIKNISDDKRGTNYENVKNKSNGSCQSKKYELTNKPGLENVPDEELGGEPLFDFTININDSPALQKLNTYNVNFRILGKMKNPPAYLVDLDVEKDIQPVLKFLLENGILENKIGRFITKNPFIFQQNLSDLNDKIHHLQSKKFTPQMINKIIARFPKWLLYSAEEIDEFIGCFQEIYTLKTNRVREIVVRYPAVIINNPEFHSNMKFVFHKEMKFSMKRCRHILSSMPRLFNTDPKILMGRYKLIVGEIGLNPTIICKCPYVLLGNEQRTRYRHLFLKSMGKNQYDPRKKNCVSLRDLIIGNDAEFCDKFEVQTDDFYEFVENLNSTLQV